MQAENLNAGTNKPDHYHTSIIETKIAMKSLTTFILIVLAVSAYAGKNLKSKAIVQKTLAPHQDTTFQDVPADYGIRMTDARLLRYQSITIDSTTADATRMTMENPYKFSTNNPITLDSLTR